MPRSGPRSGPIRVWTEYLLALLLVMSLSVSCDAHTVNIYLCMDCLNIYTNKITFEYETNFRIFNHQVMLFVEMIIEYDI